MSTSGDHQFGSGRPASSQPELGRAAERRLQASPYAALRHVRVHCVQGGLWLHGSVPTHYLKQVAQELVGDIEGVAFVVNQIKVRTATRQV